MVINTSPLLALISALDDLTLLTAAYSRVIVPHAVARRTTWARSPTLPAGLNVTGSLGVLVKLKSVGAIHAIASCIERMRAQGIWMSEAVCSAALALAGEQPDGR